MKFEFWQPLLVCSAHGPTLGTCRKGAGSVLPVLLVEEEVSVLPAFEAPLAMA